MPDVECQNYQMGRQNIFRNIRRIECHNKLSNRKSEYMSEGMPGWGSLKENDSLPLSHTCIYIYIHTYTHTHITHTHTHIYIHKYMHAYIHTYMHAMHACMHACVHTCIYIYIFQLSLGCPFVAAEVQGYNEMVETFYALHGLDAELYGD